MPKIYQLCTRTIVQLLLVCFSVEAQPRIPAHLSIAELTQLLQNNHVDLDCVQALLFWPASDEEVALFRNSFRRFEDKEDRQAIATALVEIGKGDETMFAYLQGYAKAAINHGAPIFIKYDAAGHAVRKEYSDTFQSWCKRNKVEVQSEIKLQMVDFPADVRAFAETFNPNSAALLAQGFGSDNPWVAFSCAKSLGLQGKTEILPKLISAIAQMPTDARELVAGALPYFNDPIATSAMERIIPDVNSRGRWQREAAHKSLLLIGISRLDGRESYFEVARSFFGKTSGLMRSISLSGPTFAPASVRCASTLSPGPPG